ncbi:hypothetical protein PILCRDRAFT_93692 [Piloderma croceum F 1598]|uniref:Uncharacterized protein n=1 Tax=Piloderma croceum (strain F 1598) TaxID=765440 RepID=A0A0C3B3G3_PILCF|nr:hypothetical protein PILCRDRAFT_93692 [Piloderma croceum F 1598]
MDRPTCTVVYPLYSMGGTMGTGIIVSYTWAQDILCFSALAQGKGLDVETLMLQTIIKDLADMHQVDYNKLKGMIVDHKVHNWYRDDTFALFGPGQFQNLYPAVTKPVVRILHFTGEVASVHHVLMAHFKLVHEGFRNLIAKMELNWGLPGEIDVKLLEQQVVLGQHMKFARAA